MAIIKKQDREGKIVIDLTGPEGNAYNLMGVAQRWGRQMNLDTNEILKEMREGDYEHLIKTFDKYFGSVCDLER